MIAKKQKYVANVGKLKAFLADIPDNVLICGVFEEKQDAILWEREKNEGGPKTYLSLEARRN